MAEVDIQGAVLQGKFAKPVPLPPAEGAAAEPVTSFTTRLPAFQGETLIVKLREHKVRINVRKPEEESLFARLLIGVLPWVLVFGVWMYIMRKASKGVGGGAGGLFSFGESKARLFTEATRPKVTFADVAGMDNVKVELREIIDFLKDPKKFAAIGARVPRGVLLIGAPGTGKTLLARATAGEAGVPFFAINASEFVEMFVGVGASRVRDMMKKAKAAKPSIVFIDEIDAVGRTRGAGFGGGHDEREQTLNQLLAEMDGFETNEEVIVMAASNRPDVLDPALLRPGRFDKHIVVDRPGLKERRAILEIHTRAKKLAPGVDLDGVAQGTTGMTGAELERLANVAALIALRKGRDQIRDARLRGGPRREPDGDGSRGDDQRARKAHHRVPRGGARRRRLGAAGHRPGAQGEHRAARPGDGGDPAAAEGGPPLLPAALSRGQARGRARRAGRRAAGLRGHQHRRAERPEGGHGHRREDGRPVGHERARSARCTSTAARSTRSSGAS